MRLLECRAFLFCFQAEDGIRDYRVTGVQTCALPIEEHTSELQSHDNLVCRLLEFRRVLLDRKSTRLNSSHTIIPYAVFCLKKTEALSLFGIPAAVPGHLRHIHGGRVGVNEAGSGVRSLQTSVMIGLFFEELKRPRISPLLPSIAPAV